MKLATDVPALLAIHVLRNIMECLSMSLKVEELIRCRFFVDSVKVLKKICESFPWWCQGLRVEERICLVWLVHKPKESVCL